jgi:hypothetical protein
VNIEPAKRKMSGVLPGAFFYSAPVQLLFQKEVPDTGQACHTSDFSLLELAVVDAQWYLCLSGHRQHRPGMKYKITNLKAFDLILGHV